MRKKLTYITALLFLLTTSCDNFLDVVPDDIATIDNAFTIREQAEKYLFTCYSYLPRHGEIKQNPALLSGDEFWISRYYRDTQAGGNNSPSRIFTGEQRVDKPILDFWRGENGGKDLYRGISDCNIFLKRVANVPNMDDDERERWIAEVKFLKAYYHYWLIRLYGPIPIKDVNTPVNASAEDVNIYRNSLDDCFQYVINLIDEAIASPYLPSKVEDPITEAGRITRAIASSIKAEVLITAASPLFNGNPLYADLADNRGEYIFSSNKTDEEIKARWQDAELACKEAIDLAHELGYTLYEFNSYVAQISDTTKAKLSIRGAFTEKWNSEIIWGNPNSRVSSLQRNGFPRGLDPKKAKNTSQCGNLAVNLRIANLFYTKNGVPLDEDITRNNTQDLDLVNAPHDHRYYLKEGYETIKLNLNRELRYYSSLLFDGCLFFGMGELDDENNYYAQVKKGQPAGNFIETSANLTGFFPKKLTHYKSSLSSDNSDFTSYDYPWPVMRLSNLYLLYAEALNEVGKPDEAIVYIDKIRERAQLSGVKEAWTNFSRNPNKFKTQNGLREIIQQERAIELSFEGQRFWDVRRWNLADRYFNQPVTGWNIQAKTSTDYFHEQLLYQPAFTLRDYFWPIKNTEILSNNNILQNYDW